MTQDPKENELEFEPKDTSTSAKLHTYPWSAYFVCFCTRIRASASQRKVRLECTVDHSDLIPWNEEHLQMTVEAVLVNSQLDSISAPGSIKSIQRIFQVPSVAGQPQIMGYDLLRGYGLWDG